MGLKKIVVISGYETVKEALVNQADAFAERPKIPIFQDLTGGNGKLAFFFLIGLTYSKSFFLQVKQMLAHHFGSETILGIGN